MSLQDISKSIPKIKKIRKVLKNVPTINQVRKIILAPDVNTPQGYRDRTMILVTYAGALRRKELLGLDINDVDELKETIWVKRKGGYIQELPIGSLAMEYLSTFIREIRDFFSPRGPWVFPSRNGKRLGETQFGFNFKKYCQQVGLGQFTPHSLRHARATHMTQKGCDIRAVQYFLGHRDIGSTEIYTRIGSGQVREVIESLTP